SAEHGPDEIAGIRRREAAGAAALIGAAYVCAEFRDLAIFSDDNSRRRVTELVRKVRPDIVLTSAPVDYLCDHEATSALVRDALFAASAPNYATHAENPSAPLEAIPHLYFMDAVGGVDRNGRPLAADFYLDVTATFATKRAMLAQHASQRGWLLKQHGIDNYLETMEEWTRARGLHAGRTYAEGFRRYRGHPYPQTPLLEELLGARVITPAAE
ncbi:MAG: PIG-L deacetylase family protein, partial [bacterium]